MLPVLSSISHSEATPTPTEEAPPIVRSVQVGVEEDFVEELLNPETSQFQSLAESVERAVRIMPRTLLKAASENGLECIE